MCEMLVQICYYCALAIVGTRERRDKPSVVSQQNALLLQYNTTRNCITEDIDASSSTETTARSVTPLLSYYMLCFQHGSSIHHAAARSDLCNAIVLVIVRRG